MGMHIFENQPPKSTAWLDEGLPEKESQPAPLAEPTGEQWIGVVYRCGPSVYFGPWTSLDAASEWMEQHGQQVLLIKLVDPGSEPRSWWL